MGKRSSVTGSTPVVWTQLSKGELELFWSIAEKNLKFSPYKVVKVRNSDFLFNFKNNSLDGISGISRENTAILIREAFDCVRRDKDVVLLDWHHFGHRFTGKYFSFPPWIDFPPNGDYLFFFLPDSNCWLFCDGVDECIHVYGQQLVEAVKLHF